jgi:hypothetical protein
MEGQMARPRFESTLPKGLSAGRQMSGLPIDVIDIDAVGPEIIHEQPIAIVGWCGLVSVGLLMFWAIVDGLVLKMRYR